mmetsp:Transcript_16582/g.32362  ORF Transcript_16582/g.32362 Transcript_16582/m.32362 type:complete len:291 (+) Transcript_16582:56-928(+)|eukprot:CAMPEP_0175159532 /NCGR_PEP_ID=MMETSP0087-20121206/23472_1 /TAXON_ID=136419 /ORGANISM="Unknown Unknown, Strain D1" /LENGTH=290 /DNA_ID=CAMNT_0016447587 /DNA_START=56 /DNA_END=928 /DNA_ORIENTATION=+
MNRMDPLQLEPPEWDRNYGEGIGAEEDLENESWAATQPAPPSPLFSWSPAAKAELKDNQLACDCLVIALQPHAGVFFSMASDWVSEKDIVGTLVLPDLSFAHCNTTSDPSLLSVPATTLFQRKAISLAMQTTPVPAKRAFVWASALLSHIAAKRVVVLDTADDLHTQEPAVKQLCSSLAEPHPCVELLEPPASIQGAAAAVLAHCEIHCIPCQVFVSFSSPAGDMSTVSAFAAAVPCLQQATGGAIDPGSVAELNRNNSAAVQTVSSLLSLCRTQKSAASSSWFTASNCI